MAFLSDGACRPVKVVINGFSPPLFNGVIPRYIYFFHFSIVINFRSGCFFARGESATIPCRFVFLMSIFVWGFFDVCLNCFDESFIVKLDN